LIKFFAYACQFARRVLLTAKAQTLVLIIQTVNQQKNIRLLRLQEEVGPLSEIMVKNLLI